MTNEELREELEEPFNVPDLAKLWPDILQQHINLGFSIPLTDGNKGNRLPDNEMLAEFQWIYGQYKKYIGTKRGPWLSIAGNLVSLLEVIKDAIDKDSETPNTRQSLIYQTMRNQWLDNAWWHYRDLYLRMVSDEEEDDE